MQKYFYFWIIFLVVRAIHLGYKHYKENLKAGMNIDHFNRTGERIMLMGGIGEAISCTFAAALGLIISPIFWIITTIYFIPAALVLYLIAAKE